MSSLDQLARTGDLGDARVKAYLDCLPLPEVRGLLGAGDLRTVIQTPMRSTWNIGDGRPPLADEDPVVVAAIARCAIARWRQDTRYGTVASTVSHPDRCGWCEYPAEQLRRVLDWAAFHGQFVTDEREVWHRDGVTYSRQTGRAGSYANPRWAAFEAKPPDDRRYLVDACVRDSRLMLGPLEGTTAPPEPRGAVSEAPVVSGDPPPIPSPAQPVREHDPWCDIRPDHEGDCPDPEPEP